LPPELAMRWMTVTYPLFPSAESAAQWFEFEQNLARASLGVWGAAYANTLYANLDSDRRMIGEFAPQLLPAPPTLSTRGAGASGVQAETRQGEEGKVNADQGHAEKGDDATGAKGDLKPSREMAYRLFQWAMGQEPTLKTDREVYDWLETHS